MVLKYLPPVAAYVAFARRRLARPLCAHALTGNRGSAEQVLDRLEERAKCGYVSPYNLALMYASLGDHEQALAHLEAAYEERSGVLIWGLQSDPRLDRLRAEPAFANLLRRVGFVS